MTRRKRNIGKKIHHCSSSSFPSKVATSSTLTRIDGIEVPSSHAEHLFLRFMCSKATLYGYDIKGGKTLKRRANRFKNVKIKTIQVWRESENELMDSKPCEMCLQFIKNCGIKKVIYSTNDGDFIKEKTENIISIKSSGWRHHI